LVPIVAKGKTEGRGIHKEDSRNNDGGGEAADSCCTRPALDNRRTRG